MYSYVAKGVLTQCDVGVEITSHQASYRTNMYVSILELLFETVSYIISTWPHVIDIDLTESSYL